MIVDAMGVTSWARPQNGHKEVLLHCLLFIGCKQRGVPVLPHGLEPSKHIATLETVKNPPWHQEQTMKMHLLPHAPMPLRKTPTTAPPCTNHSLLTTSMTTRSAPGGAPSKCFRSMDEPSKTLSRRAHRSGQPVATAEKNRASSSPNAPAKALDEKLSAPPRRTFPWNSLRRPSNSRTTWRSQCFGDVV